jgi:hypothetical protein
MKTHTLLGTVSVAVLLSACSLDVTNPNAGTQDAVLTSAAGVRTTGVGLEGRFGNSLDHAVWVPGVVSGELGTLTNSQAPQREFQRFANASVNVTLSPTNLELLNFWSRQYQVVRAANDVLSSVDNVQLAPGTKSGLTALAKALQAEAFGTLASAWQQITLDPTADNPTFVDHATALAKVQTLLASARADITTTPPSAEFTSTVLLPGIDLLNTIRAWQARWALEAGQYEQALAFAAEVPATATSEFRFSTVDQNPVWGSVNSNRYFGAVATLRTSAEPGDTRVAAKLGTAAIDSLGGTRTVGILLDRNATDPVPLFTQDELALIRAEAHARAGRVPQAEAEINRVRSAAGLPAFSAGPGSVASVLEEIYRQRTYSLFLTGLHWMDERRLGHIAEAKATWLPYPAQEAVGNPNVPANP